MLPPDDWTTLYATYERLKTQAKNSRITVVQARELERVTEIMRTHDDGADPFAPFGGLSISYVDPPKRSYPPFLLAALYFPGMAVCYLCAAFAFFRSALSHPKRWLFYSLRSNGLLCTSATGAVQFLYFGEMHFKWWLTKRLIASAAGLLLMSWTVLRYERRARREEYARECAAIQEYEKRLEEESEIAAAAAQALTAAVTGYATVATAPEAAPVAVVRR